MRFYHFKGGDKFEFDTHIFALNDERAGELFLIHLIMNGKIDYQMIWRELGTDEFVEPDRSRLCDALALGVEGIAKHDPERGWWPVPPSDHREHPD
jgi:hypothetical protein